MHFNDLNEDVIGIVLSQSSPYDALRLGQTCHHLYVAAIPHYLSEVSLSNSRQLAGFCAFVLSDITDRPHYLRTLQLKKSVFDTISTRHSRVELDLSNAPSLAQILRHATRLVSLNIYCLEHCVTDGTLMAALASHTGLQSISFAAIGKGSFELLSQMESRPRYVELQEFDDNTFPEDRSGRMLVNFTGTLETLKLWAPALWLNELNTESVWPRVHYLSYTNSICSLDTVAHAFPNLKELRCPTGPLFPWGQIHSGSHWKFLDFFQTATGIPSLCPVRRLDLRFNRSILNPSPIVGMIKRSSPIVISCPRRLASITRIADAAAQLKYIHFVDDWDKYTEIDSVDIESTSINLARDLSTLPLVGILFSFAGYEVSDPRYDDERVLAMARDVAALIPTLEYVGFARVFLWFRIISRSGGVPQLRRMSPQEGSQVEQSLLSLS